MLLLQFSLAVILIVQHARKCCCYVINSNGDVVEKNVVVNYCQSPCSAACSPDCLADCCVSKSDISLPLGAASSNGVIRGGTGMAAGTPVPGKPDMVIQSVEEGDTEECGDKGFGSPTDNTADPPGTITIPLPSTLYTPPRPGEDPKELPLPDFHLPASIFEGKTPEASVTLSPQGTPVSAAGITQGQMITQQGPEPGKIPLPCITPPAIAKVASPSPAPPITPPSLPAILPPSTLTSVGTSVAVAQKVPLIHSQPPSQFHMTPPPCGVTQVMPSGGTLVYPKLPPVTVSEIPKKKLPPLAFSNKQMHPAVSGLPGGSIATTQATLATQPSPLCPAACSFHCSPECRDECCKKVASPFSLNLVATNQGVPSPPASVAHTIAPAQPLIQSAIGSPLGSAPCAHNVDSDSCTISFAPSTGSAMSAPTEVQEIAPTIVQLAAGPPVSQQEKEKIDEKILKEMETKLSSACDKKHAIKFLQAMEAKLGAECVRKHNISEKVSS